MQFNSETNGLDLYSDCRYFCGIDETSDTTSYPIKAFTRNANMGLDRALMLILRADNIWAFDDTNNTGELLDVTTALTANTQKYPISITWLKIARVRIKDPNGNMITITPAKGRTELSNAALTAPAGTPQEYFLLGNFLYFDKAPNYSVAAGIEIQYQRGSSYFIYTDSTKTPGFAVQFHRLVSLYAALDFCQINGMPERVTVIQNKINMLESELLLFYASRDTDSKISMTPLREDYGERGLSGWSGSNNPRGW